jgi:4-hydroxythreonine-4-phosphate dehydrogenase
MIIPGRPTRTSAWLSFHYLESAVTLALNGKISGLVTGPVSKEGIRNAGIKGFRGQTEYLAERDGGKTVCMAFAGEKTVVGLATTHCSLKQVSSALDRKDLAQKIELLEAFCRRAYGPRTMTALLSLNPHAGEHGLFGMEEMRLLNPLIRDLRKNGRKIEGPFPSDAFWSRRGLWKRFRAVLAMYHDQGLIPVKSGLLGRTVHTTLGLSFLRFSADHGTAFDIAGKGKADWTDTAYALDRAEELARKR